MVKEVKRIDTPTTKGHLLFLTDNEMMITYYAIKRFQTKIDKDVDQIEKVVSHLSSAYAEESPRVKDGMVAKGLQQNCHDVQEKLCQAMASMAISLKDLPY